MALGPPLPPVPFDQTPIPSVDLIEYIHAVIIIVAARKPHPGGEGGGGRAGARGAGGRGRGRGTGGGGTERAPGRRGRGAGGGGGRKGGEPGGPERERGGGGRGQEGRTARAASRDPDRRLGTQRAGGPRAQGEGEEGSRRGGAGERGGGGGGGGGGRGEGGEGGGGRGEGGGGTMGGRVDGVGQRPHKYDLRRGGLPVVGGGKGDNRGPSRTASWGQQEWGWTTTRLRVARFPPPHDLGPVGRYGSWYKNARLETRWRGVRQSGGIHSTRRCILPP